MSNEGSRIEVYINTEDDPINIPRLNRILRGTGASVTDLSINQSYPDSEGEFRIQGELESDRSLDVPIPDGVHLAGRAAENLHRDTECMIQEVSVYAGMRPREFELKGKIAE